jgi:putative ABC transport system permease protein
MLLQDVRYALRTLLKNKAVTGVAVACLSLGIGVNATMFSVVDGVILKPFPYKDADSIIVLHSTRVKDGVRRAGLSYPDFRDWRDTTTTLSDLAAFQTRSLTVVDGIGDPERYPGLVASWTLFGLLGTPPVLGRDFGPLDDRPGAEPVVILSDDVWTSRYNASPDVIGRAISINGRPHTIIGVMAPKFAFPQNHRLWVPLASYGEAMTRDDRSLQVFARMKPGVTIQQAQADLAGVASRLALAYPKTNESWDAGVRPLAQWMLPAEVSQILLTMMGAVTLVLMIACANVANLLLARASVRYREIALRSALGAGRWRIIRQLLTEAVFIGLFSAPLGILFAWAGVEMLRRAIPPDGVPYFITWSLDARSLIYTVAISMLTGIVFGLAPAVQAARANLQEALKEGGRGNAGGSRALLRNSLVVLEVALSLVLLVGAAMFVRSFFNLQSFTVGFNTTPLMTMRFFLPGQAYESAEARAQRIDDIVQRVEALPGVRAAFASNFVPLGGGGGGGRIAIDGKPADPGTEPIVGFTAVTPHMRRTLEVSIVRGQDFSDSEGRTKSPVALVNQTMAKRFWGEGDPVGQRFQVMEGASQGWFTVIGVVADFRHFQPDGDEPPQPNAYVPLPWDPTVNTGLTIQVAGHPAGITSAVREQIRAADPQLPVFAIRPMEELRQLGFWQQRLFGIMFTVFGAIALLLASIGVYGVLSYSVSQRTQEIGVRVALGAARRDVLRLIVGHGMRLAAVGLALGLVAAYGAAHAIKTMLYNVPTTDPFSFGGVTLFLGAVAFLASYFPARRAMAVDPLIALRND